MNMLSSFFALPYEGCPTECYNVGMILEGENVYENRV